MSRTTLRGVPGSAPPAIRLAMPPEGVGDGVLRIRVPRLDDVDAMLPAFADPEILEAGNLPRLERDEILATLPHLPALAERGRLMPVVALDPEGVVGGGALHHLDAERAIVEIGYWLLPEARGRGLATRMARLLAGHAFALGVERVEAYVNVGNDASDRVLGRAGFSREGVVRSMPRPDGSRVDKALYSLLPGE